MSALGHKQTSETHAHNVRFAQNENRSFVANGLYTAFWADAAPIRKVFAAAFTRSGLPYFNPHSFRDTLVQLGKQRCQTPEQFEAWSKNLGHEQMLTTFRSYGSIDPQRQGELIRSMNADSIADNSDLIAQIRHLVKA